MVKINFSYTDEFSQESTMVKTFEDSVFEVTDTFNLLVDNFKSFLSAAGFTQKLIDTIQIQKEE